MALVTLIWAAREFGEALHVEVRAQTEILRHITAAITPFACILAIAGVSTRNVTSVGGEELSPENAKACGIATVSRHPLTWGFALWALAHIAPNGDGESIICFGGFAVLAIVGMLHIDCRRRETMGSDWGPVALTTSAVPVLAHSRGRMEVDWKGIGLARLVRGIAFYAILVMGHEWAFGISPMLAW